jgi:hypothetical protein
MIRGDLSAEVAPTVAVDFDALVTKPEPDWKQSAYSKLQRFPRLQQKLNWLYVPWLIQRHKLTWEAELIGYFLLKRSINIRVLVRRPYAPRVSVAVEKVLGDYPYEQGHLVTFLSPQEQAADIHQYCRGNRCLRFFTRDKLLASYLPVSLVKWIDQWDDNILR